MQKIVILSKTKYLEEILSTMSMFKDFEIITSSILRGKPDLVIIDRVSVDAKGIMNVPRIIINGPQADLTKPFRLINLVDVIRVKLEKKEDEIKFAGLTFNKKKRQVRSKEGKTVVLTMKESEILEYLLRNVNYENTSEKILKEVWRVSKALRTKTIETHIYSLRKKLSKLKDYDLIQTRPGGYMLKVMKL